MKKLLKFLLPIVYVTIILAGCQNQLEPQTLSAPQNVKVITNLTEEETTEWILSWDAVDGADSYDVYVNGKYKTTTQENELNLNYVGTFNIGVVAVPKLGNKNYAESDEANIRYTFEKVTKGLSYTLLEDGTYSVTAENAGNAQVTGRVVLADTYKGRIVSTLAESCFRRKGGFSTVVSGPTYNELTTSVKLPVMLNTIKRSAFVGCSKIEEILLPESVTKIEADAFINCLALKSVNIPQGITEINDSVFRNCNSLVTLTLPERLVIIGHSVFDGCIALERIAIPKGVISIGTHAFSGCEKLAQINLPEGINEIGQYTFFGCRSLNQINIPEGVKNIGAYAFDGCDNLKTINFPDSIESLGQNAINNTSWYKNYDGDFIYVGEILCGYKGTKESLLATDFKSTIKYVGSNAFSLAENLENIELPNSVIGLDESAFNGIKNLKSVVLSNSIKVIPQKLFQNTLIESVTIPEGIEEISNNVFNNCVNLKSIIIPNSVKTIGRYAFVGCSSLEYFEIKAENNSLKTIQEGTFYKCSSLKSIILSKGIEKIEDYAFSDCVVLNTISLPKTLTEIGISIFYNCPLLETINFDGTIEQWLAIEKTNRWCENTGDFTVICTDGKLDKEGNVVE